MARTAAKNNPWAICRASVGADKDKFEKCVLELKTKMGLHQSMTEQEFDANARLYTPAVLPASGLLQYEENGNRYYKFTSSGVNPDGTFKGGFDGCVLHMEQTKGIPKDHAQALCAYIGRKAGKLTEEDMAKVMKYGELQAEIFEEGIHNGQPFSAQDLQDIKANFDAWGRDVVQPPLVLGHDEKQPLLQNSGMPSLGWLKSVDITKKANGKAAMVGHFTDVPEVVRTAIKNGRYKRISSEIYENFANPNIDGGKAKGLALRRISLLGADIPEVKTLADVVAFGEGTDKFLYAEHEGEDQMDQEAIAKMVKDAVAAERAESEKRFKAFEESQKSAITALQEENKTLKADNASLAQAHASAVLKGRSTAIASFIEAQVAAGKVLPAWKKLGLQRFMESLDDKKVLKFSDEKDAAEKSPLAFFQEFIQALPEVVKLSEVTDDDLSKIQSAKGAGKDGVKNASLDAAVKKEMADARKTGRVLKYAEALDIVVREHPELVQN